MHGTQTRTPRRSSARAAPPAVLLILTAWLAGCAATGGGAPGEPPAPPVGLKAAVVRFDAVALSWEPPDGASPGRGYRVWRDGEPIARTTAPRCLDLGLPLTSETAHAYAVSSIGDGGAESAPCEPVTTSTSLPREVLPSPIIDDRPDAVRLYWRALEVAWASVRVSGDRARGAGLACFDAGGGAVRQRDAFLAAASARHAIPLLPVAETLDAFYSRQSTDGAIPDALGGEADAGSPPESAGALARAEWLLFRATGDARRLEAVRGRLERHFASVKRRFRRDDGLYGPGPEPLSPALERAAASVALASGQAIAADALSRMAAIAGDDDGRARWSAEWRELGRAIDEKHFDARDQIYYDLGPDGSFRRVKSIDSFAPLAAGIPDRTRAAALVYHLGDPAQFRRAHLFPSLGASDPRFRPEGARGRGDVPAAENAMIAAALLEYGFDDLALRATESGIANSGAVLDETGRLFDAYAPDSAAKAADARAAALAFAPIAGLLECMIGIEPDAARGAVAFRVRSTSRHGVERIRVGPRTVSLVCAARESEDDPCDVTVETDGPIALFLSTPWADFPIPRVETGRRTFRLMRPPTGSP